MTYDITGYTEFLNEHSDTILYGSMIFFAAATALAVKLYGISNEIKHKNEAEENIAEGDLETELSS